MDQAKKLKLASAIVAGLLVFYAISYVFVRANSYHVGGTTDSYIVFGITEPHCAELLKARIPSGKDHHTRIQMTRLRIIYRPLIWLDESLTGARFIDWGTFSTFY